LTLFGASVLGRLMLRQMTKSSVQYKTKQ